jgi:aminopeptidase YwaD
METRELIVNCEHHLQRLCVEIAERSVGSEGNRAATRYFAQTMKALGWETESQEFAAMDWLEGGASLRCGADSYQVYASPYSLGCEVEAQVVEVSSLEQLEQSEISGKLLLLHGEIAKEQLMPKNFVFYNPEEHQRIITRLEQGAPNAVICATGRNASLAGGVYPFPLIEDGDFDIPSVYMTDTEGRRLLACEGKIASLKSVSRRIPGKGYNVIARKGGETTGRIVVTAHIDAKKGTPGALDNASGVVVLLLLAELLVEHAGARQVELVAFNGEDYYAVPGQMLYIQKNQGKFGDILLNINIDGAGYKQGGTAFSFNNLPAAIEAQAREVIDHFDGIGQGVPWVQGDHSIFIQQGCPAMAVSSQWFTEHIDSQEITHTPKDNIEVVDCAKLVDIAQALDIFLRKLNQ